MAPTGGGTTTPPATTVTGGIMGSVQVGATGDTVVAVALVEGSTTLATKSFPITWADTSHEIPKDLVRNFTVTASLAVGTHTLYIVSTNYNSNGSTSPSFNVTVTPPPKQNQTITFTNPGSQTYGVGTIGLSVSATSNLVVSLTSNSTTVCTVSGTSATIVAPGTCSISADQGGNGTYNAASTVTQSFAVNKLNQTVSLSNPGPQTFGVSPLGLSMSATSNLSVSLTSNTPSVCTVSGSSVTVIAAGSCSMSASQAGNGIYNAAPAVVQSFTVNKANETISLSVPTNMGVGGTVSVSASVSSGLGVSLSASPSSICSISGATLTGAGTGSCTVTASQAGNGNYNAAATVTQAVSIAGKPQSISFSSPASVTYGSGPFQVTASATSTYPVSLSSNTTSVCTISGNAVTIVSPGTCTISGYQGGDGVWTSVASTTNIAINAGTSSAAPIAVQVAPPAFGIMSGTLPGDLGVNHGGAATYSIPIEVPPGTAGVVPKISLDYDSHAGNSLVGFGWNLGGMSRIHRCGNTIAQDGINNRINFTNSDKLCLDGQRLVLVNQQQSDSNYWAVGAEYRTEIESFSRIRLVQVNGRPAFTVEAKDGRTMTYGSTTSSYELPVLDSDASPKSGAVSWAMDSVKDRYGNYITYEYAYDTAGHEHRLSVIRYGGNTMAPHAAVALTYEVRPDAWTRYMDEAHSDIRDRVSHITTYVGTDVSNISSGTMVRDYHLEYIRSATSGRSLLTKVTACARNPQTGSQDCLPATSFHWGQPDPTVQPGFDYVGTLPFSDANGGLPMAPRISLSAIKNGVFNSKLHGEMFAMVDFENHGYTDILQKRTRPDIPTGPIPAEVPEDSTAPALFNTSYPYYHNNGQGYTKYNFSLDTNEAFFVVDVADFDGDGAPDLLVSVANSPLKVCLNPMGAGAPLSPPGSTLVFKCSAAYATTGSASSSEQPVLIDVVGDGRSGIYGRVVSDGSATLCLQGSCSVVPNASVELLGSNYRDDGSPEYYVHAYSEYSQMVDYTGVGKPYDTHFSRIHCDHTVTADGTVDYWYGTTPAILLTAADEPGVTISAPMAGPQYQNYPMGSTCATANSTHTPYKFEDSYAGLPRSGDFNGSGYSGLAYGFDEFAWNGTLYDYNRAEFTLCLSTGRGLKCNVRKKYSRNLSTSKQNTYLAPKGVGNFIGDGQPQVIAEEVSFPAGGYPTLTGKLYFCSVKGDDVSSAADGSDDDNLSCTRWDGFVKTTGADGTSVSDQTYFMDVLGTGRTQIVEYHEEYQAGQVNPTVVRWDVYSPRDVTIPGQALDRIDSVTNGFGATSSLTYKDANLSGVTNGTTSRFVSQTGTVGLTYPVGHLASNTGKYVDSLTTATGTTTNRARDYLYYDAMINVTGRGSLGFAKVLEFDRASEITTTTSYNQSWPLTGTAYHIVRTRTCGGTTATLLDDTQNYADISIPQTVGNTHFVALSSNAIQQNDLCGQNIYHLVTSGKNGPATSVNYDGFGNVLDKNIRLDNTTGGPFNTTTVNTYGANDSSRWLIGQVDSTSVTRSQGDPASAVALTRTTQFTYEPNSGMLHSTTVEPNNPQLAMTTTLQRNSNIFGLVEAKQLSWTDPDPNGGQSIPRTDASMSYDTNGRFVKMITNAKGQSEQQEHDPGTGAQTKLISANQLTTIWEADGFGRVTRELRPDGNETRMYYKQCGGDCPDATAVSAVVSDHLRGSDRTAVPQIVLADAVGHAVHMMTYGFDGRQVLVDRTYDQLGRLFEEFQPHFSSDTPVLSAHHEYDALNRPSLARTLDDNGANSDTAFVYSQWTTTITNPKQQVRVESRDGLGRMLNVKDPLGNFTSFNYDPFDNLSTTTDPNGNVTTVLYDNLGRRTDLKDPDLGWVHYDVNPLGLTWKQTSPKQRKGGKYTYSHFDALNRMDSRVEDELTSTWIYDTASMGIGQLAQAYTGSQSAPDYNRVHTYDQYGRPSKVTQKLYDASYSATPTYDDYGRIVTYVYQRGADPTKRIDERYNAYGYLARVERGSLVLWQASSQDAANRVLAANLGNGLTQTRNYYANSGRLQNGSLATSTGAQMRLTEGYVYDSAGNVQQRAQYWDTTGFTENFSYDPLNRLCSAQVGAVWTMVQFDNAGNVMSKATGPNGSAATTCTLTSGGTYVYPPQGSNSIRPHAVQSVTGLTGSFTYDDNGNTLTGASSGSSRTATWTSFDMPTTLTKGNSSSTFAYGPEHQRTRQIRSDGVTIITSGAQEVELGSDNLPRVKTYWPEGVGVEIDDPHTQTTALYWTHLDRLGSVIGLTKQDSTFQEKNAYDPWGKRRSPDGSSIDDSIDGQTDNKGFTRHEMLDQLDLVHMNGRVYDPLVARFLSGDPLVQDPTNGQNYNRYSYVLNNPTNLTDPTGFAGCDAGIDNGCHGISLQDSFSRIVVGNPWGDSGGAGSAGKPRSDKGQVTDPNAGDKLNAKNSPSANSTNGQQAGGNNQQAGPGCPSEMQCVTVSAPRPAPTQVFLVYTPTAGGSTTFGYHMFVKVVGEDRAPFYIRAGPSQRRNDEPKWSRVTGDATGTVDREKQAGFGNIRVDFGAVARRADANDQLFQQYVGNVDMTVSQAAAALTSFGNAVNAAQIPYIPTSQNSNAFATQAVQSLGLPRPIPGVTAIGNDTVLPVQPPQR